MKRLFMLVVVPSIALGSYKVESRLKVNDKTTTRVHQVSEGEHVVYPCKGMILDVVVTPVAATKAVQKDEYNVHLKAVRTTGATLGEQDKTAAWGKEVTFSCASDKVAADLTLKVTKIDQGPSSQLEE